MTTSPLPPFSPFKEEMGKLSLGAPLISLSFDPLSNMLGRIFNVVELQYNKLREIEVQAKQQQDTVNRVQEAVRGLEMRVGDVEGSLIDVKKDVDGVTATTEQEKKKAAEMREDIDKIKLDLHELQGSTTALDEDKLTENIKVNLGEYIEETVDRVSNERSKSSVKKYAKLLQKTQRKIYVALSAIRPSNSADEVNESEAEPHEEEIEGEKEVEGMIGAEGEETEVQSEHSTGNSCEGRDGTQAGENSKKEESVMEDQDGKKEEEGDEELMSELDDAERLIADIARKLEGDILKSHKESIRARQTAQDAHVRVSATNETLANSLKEMKERLEKVEKAGGWEGDGPMMTMQSQTKAVVDDVQGRLALLEDAVEALQQEVGLEEPVLKRAASAVGEGAKKLAGMVGRLGGMKGKGMSGDERAQLERVVEDHAELKKFTSLSLQQQSQAVAGLRDELYQRLDDIYAGGAAASASSGGGGGGGGGGGRMTDEQMVKRLNRLGPFLGSVPLKNTLDSKVSREEMMQLTRAINETRAAIVPYDDKDVIKKIGKLEKVIKEKLEGLDGVDIQMSLEILQKRIKSSASELRHEYMEYIERIKRVHKEIAGQMDTVKKKLETKAPRDDVEQLRREVFEEQAASITKTTYKCVSCNRPYTKTELGPEVWERERQKQAEEVHQHRSAIEASTTLAAKAAAGKGVDVEDSTSDVSDTPRRDKKAKKGKNASVSLRLGMESEEASPSPPLVNAAFKPEPPRGSQFKMSRPSPRGPNGGNTGNATGGPVPPLDLRSGGESGKGLDGGLVVTMPARMARMGERDTTDGPASDRGVALPALSQTTSATTNGTPRKVALLEPALSAEIAEGWPSEVVAEAHGGSDAE